MSTEPPLRRHSVTANLLRNTMNKILSKKKGSEPISPNEDSAYTYYLPTSQRPPSPGPSLKKSASRWRKAKKPVVDYQPPMPQRPAFVPLLPAHESYRQSAFMPGLSARFSLLREQNDPNSLIGKASDDSVLQPTRRSRLHFGMVNGLDDIAEVASIKSARSSIRPPFSESRQDSVTTDVSYQSDNETNYTSSIMNRPRYREGNAMFAGRSKVYANLKASGRSRMREVKALYEQSEASSTSSLPESRQILNVSAARSSDGDHGFDFGLDPASAGEQDTRNFEVKPNDSAKDLSHSPSLSSSENKWSTHSTRSDARSSTEATSVASQPATSATSPVKATSPTSLSNGASSNNQSLKRSDTKIRRLYEQGLDQHIYEQQSSALTRLNSIHQQRGNKVAPPPLLAIKSAGNVNEKPRQPVYALPDDASPTLSPILPVSTPAAGSISHSPSPSIPFSPFPGQLGMDSDEAYALSEALQPADRGKATAMGVFDKPKQAFDEEQYAERQRQLQRSVSNAATRKASVSKPAKEQTSESPVKQLQREPSSVKKPSGLSSKPQLMWNSRAPMKAGDVFQRAAMQMGSQPVAAKVDPAPLSNTPTTTSISETQQLSPDSSRTPEQNYSSRWQPKVLSSVIEHPAFRLPESPVLPRDPQWSLAMPSTDTADFPTPPKVSTPKIEVPDYDWDAESPEAGGRGAQLNGLVRHLRQKSNVSSTTQNTDRTSMNEMMGPQDLTSQNLGLIDPPSQGHMFSGSRIGSYAQSNPWDLDEVDNTRESRSSISPIDHDQFNSRVGSLGAKSRNRQSGVSDMDMDPGDSAVPGPLQIQHSRDASSATQKGRDALDNELATRRHAANESSQLKVNSELQSRSASPLWSNDGASKTAIAKTQQARGSDDADHSMEVLPSSFPRPVQSSGLHGLGVTSNGVSSQSKYDSNGYVAIDRLREETTPNLSVPSIYPRVLSQSDQDAKREMQQQRSRENSEILPPANRSPPVSADTRSRSNSVATSGRSRSRTGPYRDDLEKAMAEGTGSSTAIVPDLTTISRELTPRSTPDFTQSPFERPRAGSGNKMNMTSYFESNKSATSLMSASRERLVPGVPSPALTPNPYSPMLTPSPLSPTASFGQNTPPLSGASTPLQFSFPAPPPMPITMRPGGFLRKKTISKGDISEPVLISSTSNIDLVDLPEGASLKNGMEDAPPVPPLNPARRATKRILGLGRKESSDSTFIYGSRSKTPEAHSRRMQDIDIPFDVRQRSRSRAENISPQKQYARPERSASPMLNGFPLPPGAAASADNLGQRTATPEVPIEGGMF